MAARQRGSTPKANRDIVRRAARNGDFDRYLAALFVAEPARDDLMALIAFNAEVAQIADRVSEPGLGEIRLQWWRDGLDALRAGEGTDNPIADALGPIVAKQSDMVPLLKGLIDARSFDVAGGQMPDMQALRAYLHKTAGTLYLMGVRLLAGRDIEAENAVADAGLAFGFTGLMRALPVHLARGRLFLPRTLLAEHGIDPNELLGGDETLRIGEMMEAVGAEARHALARAGKALDRASAAARPAFLTLALVEPYLAALRHRRHRPLQQIADISPLNRYGRLAWAAISGRI
jgi:phytoene synthase